MKSTRSLISSSLVSLIIVLLGMFMLCMSRAPKISFDEPLVEGGGVESDSVTDDDQDFLSLLGDESDDSDLFAEDSEQSASSDDELLSLLEDSDQSTTSYEESSDSGDQGMDEILRLLELDDDAGSQIQDDTQDSDILDELLAEDPVETNYEPDVSNSSQEMASVDELSKEVENLENLLSEKTSQAENLQTEINNQDQRINEYQRQGPSRSNNTAPVQNVSNYESTPSVAPSNSYESGFNNTYSSSDYENSYNMALDLYRNREYQQAIATFFQLLQQNSRHPLADNCQYWIGECRYAQGKFYQSVVEFNKVFAYDAPDKQDDAQLMLGLAYFKLGELNSARTEFDWLVSCYYSSEYVSTANRYLGQF